MAMDTATFSWGTVTGVGVLRPSLDALTKPSISGAKSVPELANR